MQTLFKKGFSPSAKTNREIREIFEEYLGNTHIAVSVQQSLILVLSEIITNFLEHVDSPPQNAEILFQNKRNIWHFEIKDDGDSFDNFSKKMADLPKQLIVDDLDKGGMGLFLLKNSFPNHHYIENSHSPDNLNHLVIRFAENIHALPQKSLLVIDDDPIGTKLMKRVLEKEYQVTTASSAGEGILYLKNLSFDLVLCDIGLPDKSGLEIRKELMDDKENGNILPFVFITANDNEAIEKEAYSLGIDDYLSKPIDPALLHQTIKRILQRVEQVRYALAAKLDKTTSKQLRPYLPECVRGFRTSLFVREASAGGGDMVLHFPFNDSDIIILADIMGHGIEAKYFVHLYAGYLYGMIKSFPEGIPIDVMMQKLSDFIYEDTNLANYFLTCQVIEITDNSLKICSAGHPKPILVSKEKAYFMEVKGTMAGLIQGQKYPITEMDISSGERLLCYTDGLLEGDGDLEKAKLFEVALIDSLSNTSMLTLDEVSDIIWKQYGQSFDSSIKRDDTTYILLEKNHDA